jgi:hypothetical protein
LAWALSNWAWDWAFFLALQSCYDLPQVAGCDKGLPLRKQLVLRQELGVTREHSGGSLAWALSNWAWSWAWAWAFFLALQSCYDLPQVAGCDKGLPLRKQLVLRQELGVYHTLSGKDEVGSLDKV